MTPVTHYLVTNRLILTDQDGREFIHPDGDERVTNNSQVTFRFARYTFDADDLQDEGIIDVIPELRRIDITKPTPGGDAVVRLTESLRNDDGTPRSADELSGSNQAFMEIYDRMKNDAADVLFFIHGFKSDLAVTKETIRHLHRAYVHPDTGIKVIVTFAWPARKSLLLYLDDQHDARFTGFAMARVFERFHDFLSELFSTTNAQPCFRKLHLLCHSMGNQVLYYMMERLKERFNDLTEAFNQIVLAAADVPFDAFNIGEPLNSLIDICDRVHVYFHRNDLALIASSWKVRQNRLGRVGLKNTGKSQIPDDVFEVDVTSVPGDDTDSVLEDLLQFDKDEVIQHWYYLINRRVIDDIRGVFRAGRSELPVNPPYPELIA